MSVRYTWYAVDRLEGDRVILIDDEGRQAERPQPSFAFRIAEGMVLRVPLDAHHQPNWAHAVRDEQAEQRRLNEARERLERLKRRDPGGDVRL